MLYLAHGLARFRAGWSLLRAYREDIKVQQELFRHADIRTDIGTKMNVYTQAVSDQKRLAHGRIVRMLGQESA